jgi:hypothetical protein
MIVKYKIINHGGAYNRYIDICVKTTNLGDGRILRYSDFTYPTFGVRLTLLKRKQ